MTPQDARDLSVAQLERERLFGSMPRPAEPSLRDRVAALEQQLAASRAEVKHLRAQLRARETPQQRPRLRLVAK